MANSDPDNTFTGSPNRTSLWGSARLSYTILAFFSMVVQLLLRNTINVTILYMVKHEPTNSSTSDDRKDEENVGTLSWTRNQEIIMPGVFYYGYFLTLPIAGRLTDKFGGKLLFVHSMTVQAVVFMLTPILADFSFSAAVFIRVLQGLIAGFGNPALYQLFSIWAHPTERTAFLSFAYGGYSVGTVIAFPVANYLCEISWPTPFYVIGGISLMFGIMCQWFVYSSLEDHPRLSREERDYLKENYVEKSREGVPWKSILTSVPVYAFTLTHFFHTYGIMVLTIFMPRFIKEAMTVPLHLVGLISAIPFLGAFISKAITITSCTAIERVPGLNLTLFRRILYVLCNLCTIASLICIIVCNDQQIVLVASFYFIIGIFSDLAFSGSYWPSLLYVAPSYAGLLCGLANCLAQITGFLAPPLMSVIVQHATKEEWNVALSTIILSYALGAVVYGLFGSSKLEEWGRVDKKR